MRLPEDSSKKYPKQSSLQLAAAAASVDAAAESEAAVLEAVVLPDEPQPARSVPAIAPVRITANAFLFII